MKRAITMVLLFLLCTGFAFTQNGVIQELSGTVEIKPAGSADFIRAKAGDTLFPDTIISTGFRSTALILAGSSLITVRPLTRMLLTELSSAGGVETINVNLQSGRLRVDVNPPAGMKTYMTVRAPSATASVRGTSFDFDTRNLHVRSGVVEFHGSRGTVMLVNSGSASVVSVNGKAADPVGISADALVPPAPAGSNNSSRNRTTRNSAELSIDLDYGP